MSEFFSKKNLPLLLALVIPVIMVIGVAAAVYLPGLGHRPSYNFVYATGDGVSYYGSGGYDFYVKDGHLARQERPVDPVRDPFYQNRSVASKLYLHDVKANTSKELSFEEAQKIFLDPSIRSADGYEVARGGYSGDGFLFSGGRSDFGHWYIKGYNRSFQLNLRLFGSYYSDNFKFLGWVN